MSMSRHTTVSLLVALGMTLMPVFWLFAVGDDLTEADPEWSSHVETSTDENNRPIRQDHRPSADPPFDQRRQAGPRGPNRPFDPRHQRSRDRHPTLSTEQIRTRLSIIQRIDPQMAERIRRVQEENPERAGRMWNKLRYSIPHIERLEYMQEHDPEGFDLNVTDLRLQRSSRKLATRIRRLPSADEKSEKELQQLIAEHFDVRQRKMEHKLETLEKQIQMLRERVEARRAQRTEIEKHRFQELIGSDSEPIW